MFEGEENLAGLENNAKEYYKEFNSISRTVKIYLPALPGCASRRHRCYGRCSKNLPFRAIVQQAAGASGCSLQVS